MAITTLMYVALALGFDLIVGRTGLLSLAVAGFFGIGAYAAALVGLHLHGDLPLRLLIGIIAASVAALLVGIPSFRLSYHSFAMGTLALCAHRAGGRPQLDRGDPRSPLPLRPPPGQSDSWGVGLGQRRACATITI